MTTVLAAVVDHWPFILTALIVGGWVTYDIAHTETFELPTSKEPSVPEGESAPRHGLEEAETSNPCALSVPEIIQREAESGHSIRLNWTDDDTDPHGYALTRDRGEWPTAVIPVIWNNYDN